MSSLSDVMNSKVCLPEKIPADWSWVALTDVCNPKQWKTISSSEMTKSGYPVFGANGFVGFYTEYNHAHESIAITCRGNTCGTINRIPAKTYITGNSMALDDIDEALTAPNYLYHALTYRSVSDAISGSAQPQITGNSLKQIRFPLAPLPEQQKIAKILTSVDEAIEKTQAQIDKLKDLKTGMMQELLTQGVGVDGKPHTEFKDSPVGRIPKAWEVSALGDRVKLIPGYAFKSTDFVKNGVPLIRMGNLYNNKLDLARAPIYLPESFIKNHARFVVYENDIVFSMTGTSGKEDYGFAVRVPQGTQASLLNQRVAKVVAGNGVKSNFLLHLMRSRLFLDEIYAVGTGTKQANLSSSNILEVELPFPTLHEQGLIADALDSVDKLIESKSTKMLRLQFTKKALMQDLLTGKVRVTID